MVIFNPKWVSAHLAIITSSERATQNKQDGIIYNCQKQSVHKL